MATINISDIQIKFSDQFFFDTNVWLLLFGTVADYQRKDQDAYSNFLDKILSTDNAIFISSMVISEFANVLLRHDFKQWKTTNKYFDKEFKRDYVGTSDYKMTVKSIKALIKRILSLPVIILAPDNFNAINIDNVNEYFDSVDFNDAYIAELARMNNLNVVTNDRDFKSLDGYINVVTSQI